MIFSCSVCGYSLNLPSEYEQWGSSEFENSNYLIPVVRENKKRKSPFKGFVCLSCLSLTEAKNAEIIETKTRSKATDGLVNFKNVVVTKHAVDRYIELNPKEQISRKNAQKAIRSKLLLSRQIRYQERHVISRIINNNFKTAEYFLYQNIVFVVTTQKPQTVVTVESADNKTNGFDYYFSSKQKNQKRRK